jgi:hypothetical protein
LIAQNSLERHLSRGGGEGGLLLDNWTSNGQLQLLLSVEGRELQRTDIHQESQVQKVLASSPFTLSKAIDKDQSRLISNSRFLCSMP